jgi:hypothetical protein
VSDAGEKRERSDGVRRMIEQMEAALRDRFGDDHPLLTPGLFRGTLWHQAAAHAFIYADDRREPRTSYEELVAVWFHADAVLHRRDLPADALLSAARQELLNGFRRASGRAALGGARSPRRQDFSRPAPVGHFLWPRQTGP